MKNLGYYNGKIAPIEEMTVSFNDRGLYFGDGIYEFVMVRNRRIYSFDEHIERMFRSAAMLGINMPMSREEIYALICELIEKVDEPDQTVYWHVTRGTQVRNHTYPQDIKGNLLIMIRPGKLKDIYTPVSAVTEPDRRFYYCNIKTLNLLPSVLYAHKAEECGVYETILYREGGRVTECSHANCAIIKDGVFKTAPADELILPGVARAHMIRACRELGIKVCEEPYTVSELMEADEVIIMSTSGPFMLCRNVDGKPVGGKDQATADRIRDAIIRDYMEKTE